MKTFLKTVLLSILLLQGPNATVLVRDDTKDTTTIQPKTSGDSEDTFLKLRIQRDILKDEYLGNLNTPYFAQKFFGHGVEQGPPASSLLPSFKFSIEHKNEKDINSPSGAWKRAHPFLRSIY